MTNRQEWKWIIVLAIDIVVAYFFSWKSYEAWTNLRFRIQKEKQLTLTYQKKKKELEKEERILEKRLEGYELLEEDLKAFSHSLAFEEIFVKLCQEKNIAIKSMSRFIFDGDYVKFPVELIGKRTEMLDFLEALEAYPKQIRFSNQFTKLEALSSQRLLLHTSFYIRLDENAPMEELEVEKEKERSTYIIHSRID